MTTIDPSKITRTSEPTPLSKDGILFTIADLDPIRNEEPIHTRPINKFDYSEFIESDPEDIELITEHIHDCDTGLLDLIELIGFDEFKSLLNEVICKFGISPKLYTKGDFDKLIKLIILLYARDLSISDIIKEIQNADFYIQDKLGYIESIVYDNDIIIPLKLSIWYNSTPRQFGEYIDTVLIQVMFKGENVTDKCTLKINNIPIDSECINGYITTDIQISGLSEGEIHKLITALYENISTSQTISFNFVNSIYYGPTSFTDLSIDNLEEAAIDIKSDLETLIKIEDRMTTFIYCYPKSRGYLNKVLDENGLNCIRDFNVIEKKINNINYLMYYRTEKDPLDQKFIFKLCQ